MGKLRFIGKKFEKLSDGSARTSCERPRRSFWQHFEQSSIYGSNDFCFRASKELFCDRFFIAFSSSLMVQWESRNEIKKIIQGVDFCCAEIVLSWMTRCVRLFCVDLLSAIMKLSATAEKNFKKFQSDRGIVMNCRDLINALTSHFVLLNLLWWWNFVALERLKRSCECEWEISDELKVNQCWRLVGPEIQLTYKTSPRFHSFVNLRPWRRPGGELIQLRKSATTKSNLLPRHPVFCRRRHILFSVCCFRFKIFHFFSLLLLLRHLNF